MQTAWSLVFYALLRSPHPVCPFASTVISRALPIGWPRHESRYIPRPPAFPPSSDCYAINHSQLGDEAETAVRALQNVCESSATELAKNEPRLASAYHSAYEAARTAGPFSRR